MENGKLFSIGEIAKAIGITRKIILNYEAKGIIAPDKKEGSTGNRYYSIDSFTKIRATRVFQDLGLSLDEVREYFNDSTDLKPVIRRLEKMRDELNLTIEKLKERIREGDDVFKRITLPEQTIYCRNYKSESVEDKTNLLRNTALEAMKKHGTDTTKRMYFIEYSIENPGEVSYCVAVPAGSEGEHIKVIPELCAISVFHHGAYEDILDTRKKLVLYAKENNIELTGDFRHIFLEGPPQHKDKSRFITQIIAPVKGDVHI